MELEVPAQNVRTPSLISNVKEQNEAEKPKEEKQPEVHNYLFRKNKNKPAATSSTTLQESQKSKKHILHSLKEDIPQFFQIEKSE